MNKFRFFCCNVAVLTFVGITTFTSCKKKDIKTCGYVTTKESFESMEIGMSNEQNHEATVSETSNDYYFDLNCDGNNDIRLRAKGGDFQVNYGYGQKGTSLKIEIIPLNEQTTVLSSWKEDTIYTGTDYGDSSSAAVDVYHDVWNKNWDDSLTDEVWNIRTNQYAEALTKGATVNHSASWTNLTLTVLNWEYTYYAVQDDYDEDHLYWYFYQNDYRWGDFVSGEDAYIAIRHVEDGRTKYGYLHIQPYFNYETETADINLQDWAVQK